MTPSTAGPRARWSRVLEDGRVECTLCPRRCRLREGQRGFCHVRHSEGGRVRLRAFGSNTGFCVDPIEKKPLAHFLPGSAVLSFGTEGCNLGCKFCQNWRTSKAVGSEQDLERALPDEVAELALERGCASVAYTYNDPVIFAEYAIETALACERLGVRSVAVTAGYISREARAEFFEHIDAANVDLKAFDDRFYREQCLSGRGGLADVLETLVWLAHESPTWLELTTLLIPGLNDSEEELRAEFCWIRDELGDEVPLHLSAFHPSFRLLDFPPTPPARVLRARALALELGLKHVYAGNVPGAEGRDTRCASCGEVLIRRRGYEVSGVALTRGGACPSCGRHLAGHYA